MYVNMCVCMHTCVHMCLRNSITLTSEQKASVLAFLCLCPPLPRQPSTGVPGIRYPNGSEPVSSASIQVRYQCVYVPPGQGVAKGYDLKEEAWTLGQKEEGTKGVEQGNMLSLLLCVPAQRILNANPPVRVER